MTLARLAEQCRECPFVKTCEHKEMEAVGCLPDPIMADVKATVTADIAAPILRETVSRVVDGKVVTMYKDDWRLNMHNNTNNSDRMNTVAYKIGQAIALVVCLCVSSIVIALTVKCILWIL